MGKGLLFLIGTFLTCNYLAAQVEVYGRNKADTSTYIAPEDTITKPPLFGNSVDDFYRYLEGRYNLTVSGQYLSYNPENVRFSFYVERNGELSDFTILYSTDVFIGNEIERIVNNMPKWLPGKQDGKKKRTLMEYDIYIQLTDDIPSVLVTPKGYQTQFSDKNKNLKWFLVGGSLLILVTLLISSGK